MKNNNKNNPIGIIIDSTTVLNKADIEKYNIKTISLNLSIDSRSVKEVEIDDSEVMKEINNNKNLTTSSPSPFDFKVMYESMYNEGYQQIVVIPLSKDLSSTYQSAIIAKDMFLENEKFNNVEIEIIDTQMCNFGNANIIETIYPLLDKNASFKIVVDELNRRSNNSSLFFTVLDLNQLFKGGRLSRIGLFIGNLLKIKPIIQMVDGKLKVVAKCRSAQSVIDLFLKQIEKISASFQEVSLKIVCLKNEDIFNNLVRYVTEKFENVRISVINVVNPVFTTHLGDNGVGIAVTGY